MRGLFNRFKAAALYFAGTTPAVPSSDVASSFFFDDSYVAPTLADAPVYQGQGAGGNGTASTITFGKPAGLAVDDVMVCIYRYVSTAALTITPPALVGATTSWQLVRQIAWNGTTSASMLLYYKVADSADVAASDFAFGQSGATIFASIGFIQRWTGVDTSAVVNTSSELETNSGSTGTLAGLTTTVANTGVVFFGIYWANPTDPSATQWPNVPAPGTASMGVFTDSSPTDYLAANGYVQRDAGVVFPLPAFLPVTLTAADNFKAITVALTPAPPSPPVGGERFTAYMFW